jgi:hypothetical protein
VHGLDDETMSPTGPSRWSDLIQLVPHGRVLRAREQGSPNRPTGCARCPLPAARCPLPACPPPAALRLRIDVLPTDLSVAVSVLTDRGRG